MSAPENSESQPAKFTRRSERESICNFCPATLRANRYMAIEMAEEIHSDLRLLRPESPVKYVLR